MNYTHLLGVVSLLLFSACQKDNAAGPTGHSVNKLVLTDPGIGQQALYERISLAAGDSLATAYPDTIILEVTSLDQGRIFVTERISDGSLGDEIRFLRQELTYSLTPGPTGLEIEPQDGERLDSRLFVSIDDKATTLSYISTESEQVRVRGDRVIADYLPLDRAFKVYQSEELAVLHHAYRNQGAPGLTFLHNREDGLHSMLIEYDLAGNARGWRLLE